jgi:hypothetical protein
MSVPPNLWGKDHFSTLLYIETCCVDHSGVLKRECMRCDPKRHPLFRHSGSSNDTPPTRLAAGLQHNHDDWDCLDDLIDAGYVQNLGTGANPRLKLTDLGWTKAGELRRQRAEAHLHTELREPGG